MRPVNDDFKKVRSSARVARATRRAENVAMDPPKDPPKAPAEADAPKPTRGRGRGRARGRGRRVVPRQVARRKPPPRAAEPEPAPAPVARGQTESRGRGQGRSVAPLYSPNVVGLGQIAPTRAPASRAPSSAGSAGTSRKSSAVSSMSAGGASSTMSAGGGSVAGSSFGGFGGGGGDVGSGEYGGYGGGAGGGGGSGARVLSSREMRQMSFAELDQHEEDSDDDQPEGDFAFRNNDIAPCAGMVSTDGILLPVSLAGLRDLPPHFSGTAKWPNIPNAMDTGESPTASFAEKRVSPVAKPEPMELDGEDGIQPAAIEAADDGAALRVEQFPPGSVASLILGSGSSLAFLQLPGLLALTENPAAEKLDDANEGDRGGVENSVAAAVAAAERMRGLGTDLRRVGVRGETRTIGRLRFFRSGRVQIVMQHGGAIDLELGIRSEKSQQLVLMDGQRKTCEEIQNSVKTRLIGIPAL